MSGSFGSGGGRGSWWRRGNDAQRDEAVAARDAAQLAFYDLEAAQREAELAVETVRAAEDSAMVRQALADYRGLTERINQVTLGYFAALDVADLEAAELAPGAVAEARQRLAHAHQQLNARQAELSAYLARLQPLVQHAEDQLARVAPAVEQAKRELLGATTALDAVRAAGLTATESAARLAALAPELTKLNEGVTRHGIKDTLRRAAEVRRQAAQIRAEAEQLPEQAAGIDRRLASLRTRIDALRTRSAVVEPTLSELRRGSPRPAGRTCNGCRCSWTRPCGPPRPGSPRLPGPVTSSAGRMRRPRSARCARCWTPPTARRRRSRTGCAG